MNRDSEYALIVAAGEGERFGGPVPKQFLEMAGLPVVMHSINAFYAYSTSIQVVLVLAAQDVARWEELKGRYRFSNDVRVQTGGRTRFDSVRNGLQAIDGDGLVAIHDGVRPLVPTDLIAASFRLAAVHGSAVAAVRLKESLRQVDKDTTIAVDRSRYRLIQTPQTFRISLIREAYMKNGQSPATDDASVAELAGHTISLFEGSYDNIKITTREDLALAEALLKQRAAP